MRAPLVLFTLMLALCGLAAADGFRPVARRTVTETVLATDPRPNRITLTPPYSPVSTVSPKGSKLAYAENDGEMQRVVVNGVAGTSYPRIISRLHFTADDRLVYAVEKDGKPMMVFDDRECGPYDGLKQIRICVSLATAYSISEDWTPVDPNAPVIWLGHSWWSSNPSYWSGLALMSRKAGHAAWLAKRNGKQIAVLDGVESTPYDLIGSLTFSPDGRRFAFTAKEGKTWCMVIDGVAKKRYDSINEEYWTKQQAVFSEDGKHLAYRVTRGGKELLIIDGRETTVDDPAFERLFKRPGQPYSMTGNPLEKITIAVSIPISGKAITPPKEKYPNKKDLLQHPDGREWAFVAEVGDKEIVVIDGKESRPYDKILELQAISGNKGLYYIARDGKKQRIVINGRESKPYDKIENVTVSPDLKRLAYFAGIGKEWVLVVDGRQSIRHFSPEQYTFAYSPDSRHYAYTIAQPAGGRIYVVDGRKFPYPTAIGSIAFSPDGLLAVGKIEYGGDYGFVVNGMKDRMYDGIDGSGVFFDGPGKFHYFASRGDDILRVDEVVELGQ